MDKYFSGKTAVITGAGSGIGRNLAVDLAASGANVVLVARSGEILKELALETGTDRSMVYPADVRHRDEVSAMADKVKEEYGRIDILINCAGIFRAGSVGSLSPENINAVMDTNVTGTINCVKAVLPHMSAQRAGHIVILSSLAGRVAFPGCAAYSASKFALYGFSNTIRPELKKHGINLTAVYPSFVNSPLVEEHIESVKKSFFFRLTRDFSTAKVSREIMKAVKKKKREIVLPRSLTWTAAVYSICPRFVEYVTGKLHGGWPDPFD